MKKKIARWIADKGISILRWFYKHYWSLWGPKMYADLENTIKQYDDKIASLEGKR